MPSFVNCFAQDVVRMLVFVSILFWGQSLCPFAVCKLQPASGLKGEGQDFFVPKPPAYYKEAFKVVKKIKAAEIMDECQLPFLWCEGPPFQRLHHLQRAEMLASVVTQLLIKKTTCQSDGGTFSVEYPSSQMTLAYVKLTQTQLGQSFALMVFVLKLKSTIYLDDVQNNEISLRIEIPGYMENVKCLAPCLAVIHLYLLTC